MKFADFLLNEQKEYHMSHRPENTGINASDLAKDNTYHPSLPDDFYDNPEQHIPDLNDETYRESVDVLLSIRGKKDAQVTIYRAAVKNEFNAGDWITLSKKFAEQFATNKPELSVFSKTVPIKDVIWTGESINEFGYHPKGK